MVVLLYSKSYFPCFDWLKNVAYPTKCMHEHARRFRLIFDKSGRYVWPADPATTFLTKAAENFQMLPDVGREWTCTDVSEGTILTHSAHVHMQPLRNNPLTAIK